MERAGGGFGSSSEASAEKWGPREGGRGRLEAVGKRGAGDALQAKIGGEQGARGTRRLAEEELGDKVSAGKEGGEQ